MYEPIPLGAASWEAAEVDSRRLEELVDFIAGGDVVYLGEANHFVHEKAEFRMWWLQRLAQRRPLVIGEELSWSDGHDVGRYLRSGDEGDLRRAATFGDDRHVRADRDDRPTGVLGSAQDAYPTALFLAEQTRFYRQLRSLPGMATEASERFFGFDIDAPGAGYEDIDGARGASAVPPGFWARAARVEGESLDEEADRLEAARELLTGEAPDCLRADLEALIGTIRYAAAAMPARDYEQLRSPMAAREELMKRHVERVLDRRRQGELLVLMGHAFHLVKDDRAILSAAGVGPGGGLVPSLGHHLAASGRRVRSVWMLYGEGQDSQPFPDLPTRASYPPDTLNARLAGHGAPLVLPVPGDAAGTVGVGHMYNSVAPVRLSAAVDAVHFVPTVTPLRSGGPSPGRSPAHEGHATA